MLDGRFKAVLPPHRRCGRNEKAAQRTLAPVSLRQIRVRSAQRVHDPVPEERILVPHRRRSIGVEKVPKRFLFRRPLGHVFRQLVNDPERDDAEDAVGLGVLLRVMPLDGGRTLRLYGSGEEQCETGLSESAHPSSLAANRWPSIPASASPSGNGRRTASYGW